MFNPKQIEAYRSISAPESLRQAVMKEAAGATQERKVSGRIAYAAMAACILLLAGLWMLPILGIRGMRITYDDRLLGQKEIAVSADAQELEVASMREIPTLSLDLVIRDCANAAFAPSDGTICLVNLADGELLKDTSVEEKTDVKVLWDIPGADTEQEYELEITDRRGVCHVILTFDAGADSWMICRKK